MEPVFKIYLAAFVKKLSRQARPGTHEATLVLNAPMCPDFATFHLELSDSVETLENYNDMGKKVHPFR